MRQIRIYESCSFVGSPDGRYGGAHMQELGKIELRVVGTFIVLLSTILMARIVQNGFLPLSS